MVSISSGNSKMGGIKSVSLPAVVTCRPCLCQKKCYARKLERLRPNVSNAYRNNLEVLRGDPGTYWREVEAAIMVSRFFRFHVSGDIPDTEYFENMVAVSIRNPHCEILCFTKKFEIVNNFVETRLRAVDEIPPNLHIVYSAWAGLEMANPFLFPVAYVRARDGSTVAPGGAVECNGNCTDCARAGDGCWTLRRGQSVIFDEH